MVHLGGLRCLWASPPSPLLVLHPEHCHKPGKDCLLAGREVKGESGRVEAHKLVLLLGEQVLSCCRNHWAFPLLGAEEWTLGASLEQ